MFTVADHPKRPIHSRPPALPGDCRNFRDQRRPSEETKKRNTTYSNLYPHEARKVVALSSQGLADTTRGQAKLSS